MLNKMPSKELVDKILDKLNQGLEKKLVLKMFNISRHKLNTILNITNKKTKAENRYDYNKVLDLAKKRKTRDQIIQELTPDKDSYYFNIWRNSIPKELNLELTKYLKKQVFTTHKLKEVIIEKKFKYLETSKNTILPIGLKHD
jgi:hypothetical protein